VRTAALVSWLLTALLVPDAGAAEPAAPPALESGEFAGGYRVGDTGLWLGGYSTVEVSVPESNPASVGLADIGLLARYELTPRIAFFTELDLDDTVTLVEHSGLERGSRILLLERLYLEWSATPELTLRVGKFLTPFGIWNVVRRAPLTATVDRPVATQSAFPEHTTGLSLLYQTTRAGWSFDAIGYGQATDELVRGASDTSADGSAGLRTVTGHEIADAYLAVGASGIVFKSQDTKNWEDAYGADFDLTFWGNRLSGEFAYSHLRESGAHDEWSVYLQDTIPLYQQLFGVLRYEHIEPRRGPVVNGMLPGLLWRIGQHVILKADYQFADHEGDPRAASALERGFAAGVTVYF
jgi:hypothetical protein